jgi:hypothetical protein
MLAPPEHGTQEACAHADDRRSLRRSLDIVHEGFHLRLAARVRAAQTSSTSGMENLNGIFSLAKAPRESQRMPRRIGQPNGPISIVPLRLLFPPNSADNAGTAAPTAGTIVKPRTRALEERP